MDKAQAPMSDEEAAALVQEGHAEHFGLLVERYEPKLLRYGRKFLPRHEDIQDIVQDVFMRTYQNINDFDATRSFSPWIYRIAHNAFVNSLRKNAHNPLVSLDLDAILAHTAYEDPAERERGRQEVEEMIQAGLAELPPKYREVLILYYLENLSYKEIADVLEVPTGTVGIRIKRAKESLKKVYLATHPEYGR